MIAALKKPVLAFANGIGQATGSPLFFVADLSVTSGYESFYLVPGICHLLLVEHRTKDNY
jgi:hypothetical protein